jgi:hypothetical protein
MPFSQTPIRKLQESDIRGLIGVHEGLTLEFKRELNLDKDEDKREAAKDVSALANTLGGRVVYGVSEVKTADGDRVGDGVVPLTDRSVASRLADVFSSLLQPPVHLNMESVDVAGGYVLVVEVQPSNGLDLHMVVGSKEGRFYRRDTKGNRPLSEPDIREAYTRIFEQRASLDARVSELIRVEMFRRESPGSSFLVVPLFSRPNLIDPRLFGEMGLALASGPLEHCEMASLAAGLQVTFDGYRTAASHPGAVTQARTYLALLKNGVVHFSRNAVTGSPYQSFNAVGAVSDMLQCMMVARYVLEAAGYFGAVRCVHRLRAAQPWRVYPEGEESFWEGAPADYWSQVESIDLAQTQGNWGRALKDLIDPYFQASGEVEGPYFDSDVAVIPQYAQKFGSQFDPYIRVKRKRGN